MGEMWGPDEKADALHNSKKKPMTPEEQFVAQLEQYVTESDDPGSFKGMLYGEAGTGKTYVAMELANAITPRGKSICYIDSAQAWYLLADKHRERGFRMSIPGIETIPQIVKAIKRNLGRFADVGTIVVDEFSSFENMDLLALTAERAKEHQGKDRFEPKLPDMMANSNRMLTVLGSLVTLEGVNVILLCHERKDKSDSGSVVSIGPLLLPKFSSRTEGLVQLVGRVTADDKIDRATGEVQYQRSIQIFPAGVVNAKSKIGGLNKVRITPKELIEGVVAFTTGRQKEEPTQEQENNSLLAELEKVGN